MASAHILEILDDLRIEPAVTKPDPSRPKDREADKVITPEYCWWPGGIGCSPSSANTPGTCLKLLGGKGQHGADCFVKGLKMMEFSVLSRFCHRPVSSYLQGSTDVELKNVR